MFKRLIEDRLNVIVRKRIVHCFAVAAVFYKAGLFEYAELMGNCGLRHIKDFRNVANAHLALKQCAENSHSCGIAEHLEKFGNIVEKFHIGKLLRDFFYYIGVAAFAVFVKFNIIRHGASPFKHQLNDCSYVL